MLRNVRGEFEKALEMIGMLSSVHSVHMITNRVQVWSQGKQRESLIKTMVYRHGSQNSRFQTCWHGSDFPLGCSRNRGRQDLRSHEDCRLL